MFCQDCGGNFTVKDTDEWISLKCKCKCAIYYRDGYFTCIPKEKYMQRKVDKNA